MGCKTTMHRDGAVRQSEDALLAAHQRRDAFLEQRCNRLAANLARVGQVTSALREEQVERLRLKARDLQRRLDAAAAERELQLQSTVEKCSEQVMRAKFIAAKVREEEAELRRLKHKRLQERLERNGIRRNLFLEKRCMRPISPLCKRRPARDTSRTAAAVSIQVWWRRVLARRAVVSFRKAIPHTLAQLLRGQSMKRLTFGLAQRLVASKEVLKPTQHLLSSLTKLCPSLCANILRGSRILLSAIVTLLFPNQVFEAIGAPEKELLNDADHLIQSFGKLVGLIKGARQMCFLVFSGSFLRYQDTFARWKEQDVLRLLESMRRHWLQLIALKASVVKCTVGHDVSQAQWLPNIEQQQQLILQRVRQLTGQVGVSEFLASVSNIDETSSEETTSEEAFFDGETEVSDSDQEKNPSMKEQQQSPSDASFSSSSPEYQQEKEPPSPSSPSNGGQDDHGDNGGSDKQPSHGGTSAQGSAASALSDLLSSATNLELAHELIMDQNFELKKHQLADGSLESRVQAMMQKAFWDQLRDELSHQPPVFTRVLELLAEVKQNLHQVLPESGAHALRAEIEAGLDLALVSQQLAHGALNIGRCAGFVLNVMQRTCAPARDAELKDLVALSQSESPDIPELFKKILNMLAVMRLDLANYHLWRLRPALLQQAAQYERCKFRELFPNAPDDLKSTPAWLYAAQEHLAVGMSPSSTGSSPTLGPLAILRRGYIDLVTCGVQGGFPETWWLDKDRLDTIRAQLRCALLVQCVVVLTCGAIGRRLSDDKKFQEDFRDTLFILLDNGTARDVDSLQENLCQQAVASASKWLVSKGQPALDKRSSTFLLNTVKRGFSPDEPVHHLLHSRLIVFLTQAVEQPMAVDSLSLPGSYLLVGQRLKAVVNAFARLTAYNQKVFGPIYNAILKQIVPTDS